MPYKKVSYPQNTAVYRWPNDPRVLGAVPDNFVKMRWMWYPKWGQSASLAFPGPSSAIVIIAFPLPSVLNDAHDSLIGYGDYLIPQIVRPRVYQLLLQAPHALGFANQTMLGIATDLVSYPVGPP